VDLFGGHVEMYFAREVVGVVIEPDVYQWALDFALGDVGLEVSVRAFAGELVGLPERDVAGDFADRE